MTVLDAITQEKMNRAFQMLSRESDGHTVKDISAMLGFSDPVYFSRLFRKKYGMLPSEVSKT
jgi:AraC-like DNA-binding protein